MSGTQELIARLWARFQPLARDRVELIAAYLRDEGRGADDAAPEHEDAAPIGGDPVGHAGAQQAAHDLVGSLGSYGHPQGSVLAARLEALLGDGPDAMDAAARHEARALVTELQREVGP